MRGRITTRRLIREEEKEPGALSVMVSGGFVFASLRVELTSPSLQIGLLACCTAVTSYRDFHSPALRS